MRRSIGWLVGQEETSQTSVFIWSAALIFFVLVMFGVLAWVRKRLSADKEFHGEGFTLGDLRRLRESGQMSEEEFDRAKAKLVRSVHQSLAKEATKPAGPARDQKGQLS
ncbi:MAG: SHOCT domain-containing protein [Tepidisphaeraceae bacterium]